MVPAPGHPPRQHRLLHLPRHLVRTALFRAAMASGKARECRGVGCIFAELLTGHALFPGTKDVGDQLEKIFALLGSPSEVAWPGIRALPNFHPGSALLLPPE